MVEKKRRAVACKTEIMQFLTEVMRGEVHDRHETQKGGEVQVRLDGPKVSERTKAAELLGRSQHLFSDKAQNTGKTLAVRIWGEDDLTD